MWCLQGQGELQPCLAQMMPAPTSSQMLFPHKEWPRLWKSKLRRNPADLTLVSGLFSCLLR